MLSYPGPPTTTSNNLLIRSCCKLSGPCHEDDTLQTHVNHLLAVLISIVSDMSRTTRLAYFLFGGVVSHIGETTSMSYSITRDFHWEQKFGQQHDLYKIELEIEFEIAMDIKKTTSFFTFDVYCLYEKFENTKGVIRGRNSKTDRQYIDKMKRKKTKKYDTKQSPKIKD